MAMDEKMNIEETVQMFNEYVHSYFSFLDSDYGMQIGDAKIFDRESPTDAYIRIRCKSEFIVMDIAWGIVYGLQICIRNKNIADKKRNYVYFEPFIEFLTNEKEQPIIPFITGREKNSKTNKLFGEYEKLMRDEQSFKVVLEKLANKLKTYYEAILKCEASRYYDFHEYLKMK